VFSQVTVTRYGKTETIAAYAFTGLWYSVTGTAPVTVILIRDKSETGYDIALVTTEKDPGIARVIERYAARWAIEVAIEDTKQLFGTGQARNRTARAVERTVPFMLACQAIAVCWYATAGHHPADAEARRLAAPWYTAKAEPSTADMTAKLRRVIIAARFKRVHADRGCRVTTEYGERSGIWTHWLLYGCLSPRRGVSAAGSGGACLASCSADGARARSSALVIGLVSAGRAWMILSAAGTVGLPSWQGQAALGAGSRAMTGPD
jgi:hypothetical protein